MTRYQGQILIHRTEDTILAKCKQ